MRMAIIGAALLAGACGGGQTEERDDGPTVQRSFEVGAFERVALQGSHEVIVTVGGAPSVRAEGSERAIERLEVIVEDGQLYIRSRRRSGWFSFGGDRSTTVHVTVPSLTGATVAGSGEISIPRVAGESFEGHIAGSGELEIAQMRVQAASFTIGGSGHVRAGGAADRTEVAIGGSGDVDLSGLRSRTAAVRIGGSGNARLHASETADVRVAGSGNVEVTGGARCSVEKHGSGNVRCG